MPSLDPLIDLPQTFSSLDWQESIRPTNPLEPLTMLRKQSCIAERRL
jgi:hypothetical protein